MLAHKHPGRGIYRRSCPNCGLSNTEERLKKGLPCPRCLKNPPNDDSGNGILAIAEALRVEGRLEGYAELASLEEESIRIIKYFEKAVGSKPWGAQRTWARRLARRDSFSIVAPTGVGKTTFGLAASLYLACTRREKSYIMLPTTTLVVQAARRLESMVERLECKPRIIAVHSRMGRKAREEALEALRMGSFDILITTAAFARMKVDIVASHKYRLVFVDDVDAVLKSAKSVDTVLRIVGFTDEDLEIGLRILRLQQERAQLLARLTRISQAGSNTGNRKGEDIRKRLEIVERTLSKLEEKVQARRREVASLIVSTATGRPRGQRVRLFRSLLGFEAGGRSDLGLRRVYDTYTIVGGSIERIYARTVELVAMLGGGGLVFVPLDHGVDGAEKLAHMLKEAGITAEAYHSKKPTKLLDDFAGGKIDVLVGVANYYGVLVRGIDLPERVRYAVFAGVPRHKFSADIGEPHPSRLLRLLSLLVEIPLEDLASQARAYLVKLRDIVRRLSPAALHLIAERVIEGRVEESVYARIVAEAYNFLRQALEEDEVWRYLEERRDVAVLKGDDGRRYLLIADAPTYIQASGRTSRLYAGGITRGLSVVVVDYEPVFNGLVRRTKWYTDTEWKRLEEVDLEGILREIDEDRKRVRKLLKGEIEVPDLVKTALLVVESPNKARTIAGFFGQPSIRILPGGLRVYEVAVGDYILSIAASGGHVYDLVPLAEEEDYKGLASSVEEDIFGVLIGEGKKNFIPVYTSIKRCLECGHQFTGDYDRCPVCGSTRIKDSYTTVEDLRKVSWEVDVVLIGTDPDVEGEKIGWDVSLLLRPYSRSIRRLEFHEVTKKAILEALKNTRDFDQNLVDAQIVRRVEDRWIGFTLSPLLWCHFWPSIYCPSLVEGRSYQARGAFIKNEIARCKRLRYYYNLSAGRVQTPVLGWVVDRTNKSKEKILALRITLRDSNYSFIVREDEMEGRIDILRKTFKGKRKSYELDLKVSIEKEEWTTLYPPPPYTTDTMLADASRILKMGAPETMRLAQNLFEWGLITYHRTDSTRVSDKGLQVARDWLKSRYGDELGEKLYRPRRWGEGGAHEAIRPTRPLSAEDIRTMIAEGTLEIPGNLTNAHLRLYDLIFRRFMASQMREAEALRRTYRLELVGLEASFTLEGPTVIGREGDPASKGFTLVWPYIRLVPSISEGYTAAIVEAFKVSKIPLFTQGEIIQEMKNRGIGRPSTYAKIVETLLKRRYITPVEARRGDQVVSTIRGEMVYKYLTEYFRRDDVEELRRTLRDEMPELSSLAEELYRIPFLVSEERTRQLEEKMKMIEEGVATRVDTLREIYGEIGLLAYTISRIPREIMRARKRRAGKLYECISKASVINPVGPKARG